LYLKIHTYFDASIQNLQGVLLLCQNYVPVKMQSFGTSTESAKEYRYQVIHVLSMLHIDTIKY